VEEQKCSSRPEEHNFEHFSSVVQAASFKAALSNKLLADVLKFSVGLTLWAGMKFVRLREKRSNLKILQYSTSGGAVERSEGLSSVAALEKRFEGRRGSLGACHARARSPKR